MSYFRCFYHVVWATKHREPRIDSLHEQIAFASIRKKAKALKCELLAINGVVDHIHAALEIPPSLAVASVVGGLKGTSSREINESITGTSQFLWQEGYGVFTISEKNLPHILNYIEKQKEHHLSGSLFPYLERTE